jgi:hypothetical protein
MRLDPEWQNAIWDASVFRNHESTVYEPPTSKRLVQEPRKGVERERDKKKIKKKEEGSFGQCRVVRSGQKVRIHWMGAHCSRMKKF